ncbi:ABC1 kinase family protein [Marinoscillum furvescens]|uniref:ABC1 kinase family protein n=1 Tax=Marinoscillum furvescens TaxID=1026 RepID=UPI0014750DE7|nr:AarF/UbiB family protein [Marinoscillum furvescens]
MKHLTKYKDLLWFLWKHGDQSLLSSSGILSEIPDAQPSEQPTDLDEDQLIKDIADLGPAFIKLGQLLSTRPDLLPPPYIEALSKLQDNLKPFPYSQVESIVESELGVRISKAFGQFDPQQMAAASLGQVHRASLRDGRPVVVKIQRPGIRKQVMEELEAIEQASAFIENNTTLGKKYQLNRLFLHFRQTLIRELNYLKEAEHMNLLEQNLSEFKRILIPQSVADYTTDKVLTMEFIDGCNISKISPLRKLEIDGEAICDELFRSYLKQIVVDGFIHADPHPGNVHLTEDNRIALLDMGMVAHLSDDLRKNYLKLILNISENKAGETLDILMRMSSAGEEADPDRFKQEMTTLIQENQHASIKDIDTGQVLFRMIQTAATCGYQLPMELSTIGKALLNLDLVAHTLAPDFDPNAAIRKNAMSLMNKIMLKELAPQNFFSTLLEGKELIEKLPERLNKLMDRAANNELKIGVDAFDEKRMMKGFQKVANRITLGLILASLVIGSSLLMRIQTDFQLFGYPGFAIISFIIAAVGAIGLAVHIFFYDES